jgi:transcriptional regulator with XRE-family HTH domain
VQVDEVIRKLRRDADLSLRELASASGLAVSTVHRAERGDLHPTVDTLARIVSATGRRLVLEVPPDSSRSLLGLGLVAREELRSGDQLSVVRRAAELVRHFDAAPLAERVRVLAAEPPVTGSEQWDAFLGGLAEWLAVRGGVDPPTWAGGPGRFLDRGWWVTPMTSLRAWEYAGTPVSLQRRGVYLHRESLINR